MLYYLVKDDGLSHGCDKHDDCDGVTQEGSDTSHDRQTFVLLVLRNIGQEGTQEDRLHKSQAVLYELENSGNKIGSAVCYEKCGP